jgi:hypothetical protein
MAMKGRRIINFIESWSIAGSGGLEICVSSTSFQINDNGWPQQPRTEKVLKFHMIFHDSTQKNFFSNDKNKGVFNAWMTLKSSVVIFKALKSMQPQ